MTLIGYLARTHFAEAAIEDALPEEAAGVALALVLTDDEAGTAPTLARVRDALPWVRLEIAAAPGPAPRKDAIPRIAKRLAELASDTVIAIGGVGAIGQARLAAEHALRIGQKLTVIAVPVSLFDLGLSRQVRTSDGGPIVCPRPDIVIADPTVLEAVPMRNLAVSGMETLVHAIEAYASPTYNPPADGLAIEAVRRLARWLPVAVHAQDHAEARRELLAAALTAGLALEKTVGGVDALAHPLEVEPGSAGALHAPLLAAIADFNALVVGERYALLADAMGADRTEALLGERLASLSRALGLPAALRDAGIDRARFAEVARTAANDPAALANPRRLTSGDCRRILEAAW
ncbi:MAG: hypothetical protein ACRC7G_06025 [Beijerinckiaceae bacterium]